MCITDDHDPYSASVRCRRRLCPNSAWTTTERHRSWTASRRRLQRWSSGTSSRSQRLVPRNGEKRERPSGCVRMYTNHTTPVQQHPSLESCSTIPKHTVAEADAGLRITWWGRTRRTAASSCTNPPTWLAAAERSISGLYQLTAAAMVPPPPPPPPPLGLGLGTELYWRRGHVTQSPCYACARAIHRRGEGEPGLCRTVLSSMPYENLTRSVANNRLLASLPMASNGRVNDHYLHL